MPKFHQLHYENPENACEEIQELLDIYESKNWKVKYLAGRSTTIISPTAKEWTLESIINRLKQNDSSEEYIEAAHAFGICNLLWNKGEFGVPPGLTYLIPK
jgi:hypothetical protein